MTILVRMVAAAACLSIVVYRQDTSLLCAHAFVPICSSSMVLGARDMNLNVAGVRRRYGVFGSVGLMLEPLGKEGEWTAYMDEDNTEDVYYFNERTGESRWDPPSESFPKIDVNKIDGDDGDFAETVRISESEKNAVSKKNVLVREGSWAAYVDENTTGMIYYFNSKTGKSLWEPPTSTFPKIKMTRRAKEKMMKKRQSYAQTLRASKSEKEQPVVPAIATNILSGLLQTIATPEKKENKTKPKQQTPIKTQKTKSEQQIPDTSDNDKNESVFGFNLFGSPTQQKTSPETNKSPISSTDTEQKQIKTSASTSTSSQQQQKQSTKKQTPKKVVVETQPQQPNDKEILEEEQSSPVSDFMAFFKPPPPRQIELDEVAPVSKPIKIEMAVKVLAHPEKVSWGGEDAIFTTGRNFGVFDGVSGAEKEEGVPLYSVTLAQQMKQKVGKNSLNVEEITMKMLQAAEYADIAATGASTGLVASIGEDGFLRVVNVGDCSVVVIRNGDIVSRSKEVVHFFDCPYQLSIESPDRPIDGSVLQTEVIPGDIIVAGSDGIFDNLNDETLLDTVYTANFKASFICKNIIDTARTISFDTDATTPYARAAQKKGYDDYKNGLGGKVDDVSCVVVKIS